MDKIEKFKKLLVQNRSMLQEEFKVKSISLFGSYVKGRQNQQSDLDILVGFSETIDLLEFIKLENLLSDLLQCKVDLVMKDALKPRIKDTILKEAVIV